jgi:hypothetical protein
MGDGRHLSGAAAWAAGDWAMGDLGEGVGAISVLGDAISLNAPGVPITGL